MMGRSMWTGNISFGMVTIPVKLHTATESYGIAFHQLHEKCGTRIQEHRYCPHCDENVEWADIVKGYEYSKGEYVELTKEDFEKLPLPSKHTIDVSDFVDASEIDPVYYDSAYYVEVDKGSQKAHKLLLEALSNKGLAGIATVAFRSKERLCALRPMGNTLILQTLLYEEEIKTNEYTVSKTTTLSAGEKKMADTLIAAMTGKFEPKKFKDRYGAALKKLIDAKLKGKEIKEIKIEEPTGATDLMEALRASVENSGKRKNQGAIKGDAKSGTKTKTVARSKMTAGKGRGKSAAAKAKGKKKAA